MKSNVFAEVAQDIENAYNLFIHVPDVYYEPGDRRAQSYYTHDYLSLALECTYVSTLWRRVDEQHDRVRRAEQYAQRKLKLRAHLRHLQAAEINRLRATTRSGKNWVDPYACLSASRDPERKAVGRTRARQIATLMRLAHIDLLSSREAAAEFEAVMEEITSGVDAVVVNATLDVAHTRVTVLIQRTQPPWISPVCRMWDTLATVSADYASPPRPAGSREPVWCRATWYRAARKHHTLHPHGTRKTDVPGGIAVAETYLRLYAQRFTVMKPGRYLTKYFGDVLPASVIKELAQKQIGIAMDAQVFFAKTGDEIVWVYENSPQSCMKMTRADRYIYETLDFAEHPVRAYAHPENNLAVAFILRDKMAKPAYDGSASDDSEQTPVVCARALVNTKYKVYNRVYGNGGYADALIDALQALGYAYGDSVLADELLSLNPADPYISTNDYPRADARVYAALPYIDGRDIHVVYEQPPGKSPRLYVLDSRRPWAARMSVAVAQYSSGVVAVDTSRNWFDEPKYRDEVPRRSTATKYRDEVPRRSYA